MWRTLSVDWREDLVAAVLQHAADLDKIILCAAEDKTSSNKDLCATMHEYTKAPYLETETTTLTSRVEEERLLYVHVQWDRDNRPLYHNNPCPVSD